MEFIKFQSLGNDFIIFDFCGISRSEFEDTIFSASWKNEIQSLCDRHFGVGGDGVLILTNTESEALGQVHIFNSDGSKAELCLNGLRSAALYFHLFKSYPSKFVLLMGGKYINCVIGNDNLITLSIPMTQVIKKLNIDIPLPMVASLDYNFQRSDHVLRSFSGYFIEIGNPHFVLFEKIDGKWLNQHGKFFEKHEIFPNGTNTEFIWEVPNDSGREFEVLVYERGCGITLACSSGATAILNVMCNLGQINKNEQVKLNMPGGSIKGWVEDSHIFISALANPVFRGELFL